MQLQDRIEPTGEFFTKSPKPDDTAPDFTLPDHTGEDVSLSKVAGNNDYTILTVYRGHW